MADTIPTILACPKCKAPLPVQSFNTGAMTPCPSCSTILFAAAFPALFRPIEKGSEGEAIVLDDEASCFYHPDKRATIACEACGRFLCDLCHIDLSEQHLCPGCVQNSKSKGRIPAMRKRVVLYDELALALAVWPPVLVFSLPLTCVTAPAAIVTAIIGWKRPGSILPRTKARFVIAIILATLQVLGWIGVLVAMAVTG